MSPENSTRNALFSLSTIASWASCLGTRAEIHEQHKLFHSKHVRCPLTLQHQQITVNWSITVIISASSVVSESRCWSDPMDVLWNLILDALSTFLTMAGIYQILKDMLVAVHKFDVWILRDNIRGQMYAIQAIGNVPTLAQPFQMCTEGYRSSQADILNSLEILESFIITPSTRIRDLVQVNEVLHAYKERLTHLQNSYKAMCQGLSFTDEEDERMTMAEKWTRAIRSWEPPSLPATLVGKEAEITV
ncbi:hypothetical protein DFS33DRAFT_1272613 [Desarmillaria ectypa]|nr:hypothetical protein DFS33DRAFT_1272613 [Desarmillaria ectypa]